MVYTYRVTLSGIKGFYRVYKVNAENSLYSFYKQMRDDMEFPRDQVILFKGMDSAENVAARYGLVDLGYGTVDGTTMSQTVKKGVHSFVFFYDVTNRKSGLSGLLDALAKDDDDDEDPDDEDVDSDDEDDDDEEDDEPRGKCDEDGVEIYDGTEELSI